MIDREFYMQQLAKYKQSKEDFSILAANTTDPEARAFYQRQADRAAAYVADYEQDLAE